MKVTMLSINVFEWSNIRLIMFNGFSFDSRVFALLEECKQRLLISSFNPRQDKH